MNKTTFANQNSPENIQLLKASSVAYTKAKNKELIVSMIVLFLAIAYPACTLYLKDKNLEMSLFGISFFLTILIFRCFLTALTVTLLMVRFSRKNLMLMFSVYRGKVQYQDQIEAMFCIMRLLIRMSR